MYNDTTGQPANIPEDPSVGTTCSGYGGSGTCRADGCPAFSIPMNISNRIEPEMWILAGHVQSSAHRMHELSQALNNPPTLLFGSASDVTAVYAPLGHDQSLPSKVHALTLRPQLLTPGGHASDDSSLVFRLQHIDAASLKEVHVDFKASGLCNIFGDDAIVEERTLTMNFPLSGPSSRPRWSWTAEANNTPNHSFKTSPCHSSELHIAPGDLRSFKVKLAHAGSYVI